MMMPHPLLPMGLPPASVAMAMSQMNHLNTIANMAAAAQQIHTHVHRAPVIKVGYIQDLISQSRNHFLMS